MEEINSLIIEGTKKTPLVNFDKFSGELLISGRSIPENSTKFYEPLILWLEEYIKSPQSTTNLRLNLEYFNSSTTLWIARMIRILSKPHIENSILFIHLYFDEEDYKSMDSEELKDILSSLIFNIVDPKVSIGVKIHYTDGNGKTINGSTVLFSSDKRFTILDFNL